MKTHFPIFAHNPGLVYLDSAASTQKPSLVIDGVRDFLQTDYGNIHRGLYSLSERSENFYYKSKIMLADLIHCEAKELIYSYNSTYCFNLLAQALVNSGKLGKGDTVLLGMHEHHSDIVSRQILSQTYGFKIKFISLDDNYNLDLNDFNQKYDESVRVVAINHVSNVTGQIINVAEVKKKLRDSTFFIVDGSQSVPHIPIDVQEIGCDALIMTAHKMFAHTGLGMLFLKHQWIKELTPLILGGGTVKDVSETDFSLQGNVDKWEAGTPNIVGAVSLLKALEFIQSVGGMEAIHNHEKSLVNLSNKLFKEYGFVASSQCIDVKRDNPSNIVFGTLQNEGRIGVYSFEIAGQSFNRVAETFADKNICIRGGGHCAYPLHKFLGANGSVRMSLSIYNDEDDIRKFFEILNSIKPQDKK